MFLVDDSKQLRHVVEMELYIIQPSELFTANCHVKRQLHVDRIAKTLNSNTVLSLCNNTCCMVFVDTRQMQHIRDPSTGTSTHVQFFHCQWSAYNPARTDSNYIAHSIGLGLQMQQLKRNINVTSNFRHRQRAHLTIGFVRY
jgi:hypothetical protein